MSDFFDAVPEPIRYAGPESDDLLTFRWYDKDRIVGGKTLSEHLRLAACYWHSFNWPGNDVFGDGTFDRPWLDTSLDPMDAARTKMAAAFEFFEKLGVPYFSFHDHDIAPYGGTFAEESAQLRQITDEAMEHMERTGVKLLWGTARLFHHPRYMAGAATNPDPEVFARGAAQVANCLDVTSKMGGENYVMWGGREGYETLLNTDLGRERAQLGRFMSMVVEHKHKIGFEGTLLIEPKPQEPTKHQYDYDSATVHDFLQEYDLLDEIKVNIEVNHATLSGHDFAHEVAVAFAGGIFGSVDANRGDDRLGWDTDQFPNSVDAMVPGVYEIIRGGGFQSGGFMFDTKLRRMSIDRTDLFHGHIGGIDVLARAFLVAHSMWEDRALESLRDERYSGWDSTEGQAILRGDRTLDKLRERVAFDNVDPAPVSGSQEAIEALVNRYIERVA